MLPSPIMSIQPPPALGELASIHDEWCSESCVMAHRDPPARQRPGRTRAHVPRRRAACPGATVPRYLGASVPRCLGAWVGAPPLRMPGSTSSRAGDAITAARPFLTRGVDHRSRRSLYFFVRTAVAECSPASSHRTHSGRGFHGHSRHAGARREDRPPHPDLQQARGPRNRAQRDQQSSLIAERATLVEKSELARSRVEAMITRLRAMETGT